MNIWFHLQTKQLKNSETSLRSLGGKKSSDISLRGRGGTGFFQKEIFKDSLKDTNEAKYLWDFKGSWNPWISLISHGNRHLLVMDLTAWRIFEEQPKSKKFSSFLRSSTVGLLWEPGLADVRLRTREDILSKHDTMAVERLHKGPPDFIFNLE